MKQVLLRVPDDVHQRLAQRAAAEHRSVNALATELLDRAVDVGAGASERARITARARRLGLLVAEPEQEQTDAPPGRARAAAIAASQGIGAQLDRLLDEGR